MGLIVRRSPIATQAESEDTLAEAINIAGLHALLYRRGATELADLLTAHLRPRQARALAADLREYARQMSGHSIFRDYRTQLNAEDAETIGLTATWYERAGSAGCRTWADLREGPLGQQAPIPTRPPPLRDPALLDAARDPPVHADTDEDTGRRDGMEPAPSDTGGSIMPAWLSAPESSVWNQ